MVYLLSVGQQCPGLRIRQSPAKSGYLYYLLVKVDHLY